MTTKMLDELCGGAPTITLHCPWCRRTVGPYYSGVDARAALNTHLNWVHFPDADRPVPCQPKELNRAYRKH